MKVILQPGGARAFWKASLPDEAVGLAWLGQAGFALRHAGRRWLIDPYLSDHLARKYAGTEFPHERMMPPPVNTEEIRDLDLVLCSHRHGDHMDAGSLPTLAENNPRCRFVVPRVEVASALRIGLTKTRLIPANAGDSIRVSDAVEIHVLPSAHETLQANDRGEHPFLGFILKLGAFTLYHSGDCVVYDGLAERLRKWTIDLALLPVNGRSDRLTSRGILGNMTFDEAQALCVAAGIGAWVPHHFGMFAFNTADAVELLSRVAQPRSGLRCILPSLEYYLLLESATGNPQPSQTMNPMRMSKKSMPAKNCLLEEAGSTAAAPPQTAAQEPLFRPSERFHLDPDSPVPLYHQMEQIILDRIEAEGAVGRRLPREMDLVKIFGVSRITIKKVTDSLAAKGLIRRQRALGTHLVSLGVTEELGRLTSYTEQMKARGLQVSTEILGVDLQLPSAKVREQLQMKAGEKSLCLRRLRGTSKVFPIVLLQSEIPAGYNLSPEEDFCGSLYYLLETKYRIPIEWGEEQISASRALPDEARHLRIKTGDVVLVMERLTFTSGNRPLEFVRAVYRPEHYTFSVRLKR